MSVVDVIIFAVKMSAVQWSLNETSRAADYALIVDQFAKTDGAPNSAKLPFKAVSKAGSYGEPAQTTLCLQG